MLIFRTLGRSEQNYNLEAVMHLGVFHSKLECHLQVCREGICGGLDVSSLQLCKLESVTSLFQSCKDHGIILQAFGYSCLDYGFDFVVVI